jgi:hypothetical protein
MPPSRTDGLRSLKRALERDDPRLITRATVYPPYGADEPVGKCCPLAWAILSGHPLNEVTPELLDARFLELCIRATALLGGSGSARLLLNEIDTSDRETMVLSASYSRAISQEP